MYQHARTFLQHATLFLKEAETAAPKTDPIALESSVR
jgi:hypothetical protein